MTAAAGRIGRLAGVPPLRSISNIRGDDLELVEKSRAIGLDALYVDLEEPKTPLSEADRRVIRAQAGEWFARQERRRGATRLFARVQPVQSGQMRRDLEAIACPALEAVLLPKVEGPAQVAAAEALVAAVEADRGLEPGSILLYPILETAQALRNAFAIVASSPRVAYMGGAVSRFGDIVQAVGFRWSPGGRESLMFRAGALLDCRAAGMLFPVTGGSSVGDDDLGVVRRWAEEGRALGYKGSQIRALPAHVAIVNEVFTPTPEELSQWRAAVTRADAGLDLGPDDGAVESARCALRWAQDLRLPGAA